MQLEPNNLGVPLYPRDRSAWWPALARAVISAGCAWLWHRPTRFSEILVSCFVGGLGFWLVLGPGLNRLKYHRSGVVRLLVVYVAIGALSGLMGRILPLLFALVAANP